MEHPLASYRTSAGLTQYDLAKLLGTTIPTISRIEVGRRRPSPALTLKIEAVTGVSRSVIRPDIYPEPASAV